MYKFPICHDSGRIYADPGNLVLMLGLSARAARSPSGLLACSAADRDTLEGQPMNCLMLSIDHWKKIPGSLEVLDTSLSICSLPGTLIWGGVYLMPPFSPALKHPMGIDGCTGRPMGTVLIPRTAQKETLLFIISAVKLLNETHSPITGSCGTGMHTGLMAFAPARRKHNVTTHRNAMYWKKHEIFWLLYRTFTRQAQGT